MTALQKANVQVLTAFECSRVQHNPIRIGNICGGAPGGGVGKFNRLTQLSNLSNISFSLQEVV